MENVQNTVSVAYRPQPGDPKMTEVYGRRFKAGEFVDLPLEFADRARNNPSFEVKGEETYGDKQSKDKAALVIPDDPDFPKDAGSAEDISFEDAVRLERAKEYGTADPVMAERLRSAREHNRDLVGVARLEAEALVLGDAPPADDETRKRAAAASAEKADIAREKHAEQVHKARNK